MPFNLEPLHVLAFHPSTTIAHIRRPQHGDLLCHIPCFPSCRIITDGVGSSSLHLIHVWNVRPNLGEGSPLSSTHILPSTKLGFSVPEVGFPRLIFHFTILSPSQPLNARTMLSRNLYSHSPDWSNGQGTRTDYGRLLLARKATAAGTYHLVHLFHVLPISAVAANQLVSDTLAHSIGILVASTSQEWRFTDLRVYGMQGTLAKPTIRICVA